MAHWLFKSEPDVFGWDALTAKGLEIVGVLEVSAACHPDSTTDDARWECVDVRAVAPLPKPVSLDTIKADPRLSEMVLVKNSRLSVQPVTDAEWQIICDLGGYTG